MANEDDHLQVRSPYLDARGAIAYLQLPSHSSLYRLIRQHALPFNRRGRLYLFDRRDLDAWVKGFGSAIEMARAEKRSSRIRP